MKKEIHPTSYIAKVTCNSCNSTFDVFSTLESFNVEVCSNCHPFYTGDQRIMDTAGRADKFRKRMEKAASMQKPASKSKTPKEEVATEEAPVDPAPADAGQEEVAAEA